MTTPSTTSMGTVLKHRPRSARHAVALLEVVVALSILLLAMAVVGMAFRNSQLYVDRAEQIARATQMTDRLMGELSTGLSVAGENEATGSYGDEGPPDMCWRVVAFPADQIPGLINLEIEIFMGAPDAKPEERQHVLTTYAQQALFEPVNMQRDFGMTAEQLDQLTQTIPGGAAVFDPKSFDPRSVARLDMDMLKQILPVLIQAFGGQAVAENMGDIMKALQTGDTSGLQDLAQQAQQGQIPGVQQPGAGPKQPGSPTPRPPSNPRGNDVPKGSKTGGKK